MASYDSRSPSPASSPSSRRMRSCAKRFERACCTLATYFPLGFIYSLTTWAVWVDARVGFHKENPDDERSYSKTIPSAIGVVLYLLLNTSYTIAVFTHPGSPTNSTSSQRRGKYSVLPTSEPAGDLSDVQTITVSSSGGARYCKKCHVPKPDRTHHCSTCKRCVLKMDHHCPWLATCLGLHNYKAFLLFLIYVSLFCWACFLNTVFWVYKEVFESNRYVDGFGPVNVIILAILSGLIGLVLTGFTAWHIYLSVQGQTTIECLEQTRYLSGVRKQVEANRQEHRSHNRQDSEGLANNLKRIGDQVLEFHANAVPGASRYEEGEEHVSPSPSVHLIDNHPSLSTPQHQWHQSRPLDSPAQRALRTAAASNRHSTYHDLETQRASDRYEEYMSDQETSKLPNAFDLGWRKNLLHVFGPNPLLWWLPVCNTTGDGWRWEVSEKWAKANEEVSRRRDERLRQAQSQDPAGNQHQGWDRSNSHGDGYGYGYGRSSSPQTATQYYDENHNHTVGYDGSTAVGSGDYGADSSQGSAMSMHTLQPNRPRSHNGKGTMRREFDRGGDDGEVDSFQVSGSEDESSESESEKGDDDDAWDGGSKPKFRRDNGSGSKDRDEWERQW